MNMDEMKEMFPRGVERVLSQLGLEKRRSTADYVVSTLGVFAAGALVGGVLALLFAPSSGRELRGQIESKLRPEKAHEGKHHDGKPNGANAPA